MGVAILELLAKCSGSFCRPRGLNSDDLNKFNDAAPVVLLILFAGEAIDLDSYGTECLFLKSVLAGIMSTSLPRALFELCGGWPTDEPLNMFNERLCLY